MRNYFLKRLLLFPITLLLISILIFLLSAQSPLDQLSSKCSSDQKSSFAKYKACLEKEWEVHQLNKPLFYFSIQSLAEPDTFYKIYNPDIEAGAQRLILQFGNWPEIQAYYQELQSLDESWLKEKSNARDFSSRQDFLTFKSNVLALTRQSNAEDISLGIQKLATLAEEKESLKALGVGITDLLDRFQLISQHSTKWKSYVPSLSWQGFDNRYHHWLAQALRGNFGRSYDNNRSINAEIWDRLGITLQFSIISLLLAVLISIPLGVWAAKNKGGWIDKGISLIAFSLESVPNFWMATLLILAFANPATLYLFEVSYEGSADFWTRINSMVLPLMAYAYGSIASLSMITRNSLLEIEKQNFIRTARAKGLSENRVIWKHAMRNALLPMISLSVFILPALFSGSVIFEEIFTINGLGRYIYEAVQKNNTPIILGCFSLLALLTLTAYLISDLLLNWADPRIKLSKQNK
ncbi:MAG: ABC transporter permease [Bacteroidota bacterium]